MNVSGGGRTIRGPGISATRVRANIRPLRTFATNRWNIHVTIDFIRGRLLYWLHGAGIGNRNQHFAEADADADADADGVRPRLREQGDSALSLSRSRARLCGRRRYRAGERRGLEAGGDLGQVDPDHGVRRLPPFDG